MSITCLVVKAKSDKCQFSTAYYARARYIDGQGRQIEFMNSRNKSKDRNCVGKFENLPEEEQIYNCNICHAHRQPD